MASDRYVREVVRWIEDTALEPTDERFLRNRLQCFIGYRLLEDAPLDYQHRIKPQIVRRVMARSRAAETMKAIDFFMLSRKIVAP